MYISQTTEKVPGAKEFNTKQHSPGLVEALGSLDSISCPLEWWSRGGGRPVWKSREQLLKVLLRCTPCAPVCHDPPSSTATGIQSSVLGH